MIQAYPLDSVIRRVSADMKSNSPAERVIIIDATIGKAVFSRRIFHDNRYFLVTNSSDGRKGAECQVPIIALDDYEKDRRIGIKVSYLATCSPGYEERVAIALYDGPHPAAVLNEKIRKWIIDFAGPRMSEFIDNYFDRVVDLQSHLKSKAREEVGLELQIKLLLEGESSLVSVPFGPLQLPIRMEDYDEEQVLKVRGELVIDEKSKINVILHSLNKDKLEGIIKEETQKFFAEKVNLQQFYTELNSGTIKLNLISHLNTKLTSVGRKVGFLSLENLLQENSEEVFFETKKDVKCNIQEYPEQIVVKNTVQMTLQDLARYRAHKSPDLETWVSSQLERIVRDLLLDIKYIDVLLGFKSTENRIKERLSAEAEAIGYNIKQLITVPELEPLTWLSPFNISIQGKFETNLANFYVNLHLEIVSRISDLEKIEPYLNGQQNVPKLMEEAIFNYTRQLLHTVDPERFYIRFSYTERAEEVPVERELVEGIIRLIKEQFYAEAISVTPKVGDTEITTRLRKLQKKICPFVVELFLPDTEALVPVMFTGNFRVEAVDANGWHKFRQVNYDMQRMEEYLREIREHLQDSVSSGWSEFIRSGQSLRSSYHPYSIEDEIKQLAVTSIKDAYGLIITVLTIQRRHNELEKAAIETQKGLIMTVHAVERHRIESLSKQIAVMENVLLEIIAEGATEQEIERQKQKIAKVRAELPSGLTPSISGLKKQLSSKVSGRNSLYNVQMPKSLTAGKPGSANDGGEQ